MLLIDVVAYSSPPTGAVSCRRWPTSTDCFVLTCRVRPAVDVDCSSLRLAGEGEGEGEARAGRSAAWRVSLRVRMPSVV
jgi:hypothetical protein